MTSAKIDLHKTRDFSKKLSATIDFLKENFKPFFKSLLYISGPFIIIGSLFFTQIYSGFFRVLVNQSQSGSPVVDPFVDQYISMAIYGLAGIIFMLIGGTAIVATVNEYFILYEKKGSDITVKEVWERVKATFFTVLGTAILYALILFAGYIIIVIPTAILANVSVALVVITVIICFVGLIYISNVLSLVFIVRAYEHVGFGTAVRRCFFLVKEKWWSTFGIIFITSFIRSVISGIFFIPWYVSFFMQMMHNIDGNPFQEPSLLSQIINNASLLLYFVSSLVLYCLPLIAINFQYFNLVERKEARGLMSKIETFGSEQSNDDDEEHY